MRVAVYFVLIPAVWLAGAGAASAQEPAPPADPPAREGAVRRPSRAIVQEPPAAETPANHQDGARRREPASDSVRQPAPAPERAVTAPSAGHARNDQERPGAVRRPPDSPHDQSPRDRAVPRTTARPRPSDGPDRVYIPPGYRSGRYYDPYLYGGPGVMFYSPWGWMPSFYTYGYGTGYGYGYPPPAYGYPVGSVKLKVDPKDAEVYVDGYFAGHVDDFDSFWQALKLESGAYRIEIRKTGYETLHFDVRVQPDRTITFRGEMREVP